MRTRTQSVNAFFVVAVAMAIALAVASRPAAASTPATADWFSHSHFTSSPKIKNWSSWDATVAVGAWASYTRINASLVTSGHDMSIYGVYDNGSAYWAWVEAVYRNTTICGGLSYGDTGNCNHTTLQSNFAYIYVNTYYSPWSWEKNWTIAHELGHTLGLKHHSTGDGLMASSYQSTWNMAHVDYHIDAYY